MMSPVLSARQCLPDPNNYHEFCRLLARLKSNYQLGELVKVENYPEVIRLIANFTVTSLQVSAGSQAKRCCQKRWRARSPPSELLKTKRARMGSATSDAGSFCIGEMHCGMPVTSDRHQTPKIARFLLFLF